MVVTWITWPYKLVYRVDGKPAEHEELTLSMFLCAGYRNIRVKKHDAQASERTDCGY